MEDAQNFDTRIWIVAVAVGKRNLFDYLFREKFGWVLDEFYFLLNVYFFQEKNFY